MLSRRRFLRVAALGCGALWSWPALAQELTPDGREDPDAQQWLDLVAAARAEGKLSLITYGNTWGGPTYRGFLGVARAFEQAFPSITVDVWTEASASTWLPAVKRTPVYDLVLHSPAAALSPNAPRGIFAPLRPLLFRTDVLDDAGWRDGLGGRFLDDAGETVFGWEHQAVHVYAINTELVAADDIVGVPDLLQSRWRGRIISGDPRLGLGLHSAAAVARTHDTDVLARLLRDQRPTITGDNRRLAEGLVNGQFAIAMGLRPKALAGFDASNVAFLDLPDADFATSTSLLYFRQAPHPAAAQLFANWILTQPGQALLTSSLPTNSARTDVDTSQPDGLARPGAAYFEPDRQSNQSHIAATQAFVRTLLR